jgi:hypothetical protein
MKTRGTIIGLTIAGLIIALILAAVVTARAGTGYVQAYLGS